MGEKNEAKSEKKRLTVAQAKRITKAYLKGILDDDVIEKDGVICYRGPVFDQIYMLSFHDEFDKNSMLLSVKRIPNNSEFVEDLDWIDELYKCTYMSFLIDFIVDDEDLIHPFFQYNYWFSTLNSKSALENIIDKVAISEVAMCELVFQNKMEPYFE